MNVFLGWTKSNSIMIFALQANYGYKDKNYLWKNYALLLCFAKIVRPLFIGRSLSPY